MNADLPDTDYARAIRLGIWILVLGFGGFLAWAFLAPLDQGVPAPGVVAVESNRKRIDHPSGGVIDRILVREGQLVREGEDLIVLNETQARSALNATLSQWYSAQAILARLIAERDGASAIAFPQELLRAAAGDKEVASLARVQEGLFRSRRQAVEGELRIIAESARGLESQLDSLAKLKDGRDKQVSLFNEQLDSFQRLKKEGFVSRNYLLEVERQLAEVQSRQSEDMSNIAAVNARLSEFRMRGAQRQVEYRREVETLLTDVQREAATLGERLAAHRDTVERLAIKAPVSGIVVDLAFHTVGGVIKPGDRILDMVPLGDQLIVEAKAPPQYIDRLHAGLPADVHFDAYASRVERPVMRGTVDVVSADSLIDQRSGTSYYTLRVKVPAEEAKRLGDLKLQPGMQSTVIVKTGESSLMVYLIRPILRRFTTALAD
ncbi:MAG: HlyD family type secretion periplasmic adaptor subunit [Rhodocyclaceae bacterium]|nr:HlyD family type secretion periplasmic adaptor subunit [Rhodocyclaceae bacterium]